MDSTADHTIEDRGGQAAAVPGLVVVWRDRRPTLQTIRADKPVTFGRTEGDVVIDDRKMSRRHVEVTAQGPCWAIRDLDSHNGTFVAGRRITGSDTVRGQPVIRFGDTIAIACWNIHALRGEVEVLDGVVVGPTLRTALDAIAIAARTSSVVHLTGETGAGKELAARRFHTAHGGGPFVAVNCAAIPLALAESLLFGVKKGAFSGADADRDGYLASADGGTLFLDEVGELPLDLQAKLLRVLETREVVPVGAAKPRQVDLRVCSATHHALRDLVAAGTFRDDLYYRIGRPAVALPPLRDRREDIGFLAAGALGKVAPGLAANASFVEQLLLRPWPGNVRELIAEVGDSAARALAQPSETVVADHLDTNAGMPFGEEPTTTREIDAEAVRAALDASKGNVAAAARALGLHRNQLRRFLAKP